MINYTRDHSVADGLRHIAGWQTGMFQGGDMMEEFAAKADRPRPEVRGHPRPARLTSTRPAQPRLPGHERATGAPEVPSSGGGVDS